MLAAYGIFKSAGFCSLVTLYHISFVFTLLFVSNVQELRFTKTAEADSGQFKAAFIFFGCERASFKVTFSFDSLAKKNCFKTKTSSDCKEYK